MRILFLLTQDLESPSGLGRYFPLAKELTRLGHKMTIAALHSDIHSLTQTRFIQDGVEVLYAAPMHVRKQGSQKSYYPAYKLLAVTAQATWQLSRAALNIPADVVHIGKPHPMNSLAGLAARFARGRRLFLDCDDYEAGVGHFGAGWQKWGVSAFENRMPFLVETVTTNTHFTRQRLVESGLPAEKIVYVSNGVDRERFAPPPPEAVEQLRGRLGLRGKRVVAFVGSLSRPGHPVELLFNAFAGVRQAIPEAHLMLVGGGDDFERLEQQARSLGLAEAVLFCGRVPPDQVAQYYCLADVSIDPVYDDGAARGRSPLKLFESWACGVPFVSADVGDRRILAGEDPAALLARPGDPASLAGVILQVLSNPEVAARLRRVGLERVQAYYWDRLALDMQAAYLRRAPREKSNLQGSTPP